MKKNIIFIIFIILYSHSAFAASLDDLKKKGADLLKKNTNIEIAVKGKKLEDFFSNNTLFLDFEGKKKEFRFQENKYEIYIDSKITEKGKWKVSGLFKNQIKLTPESEIKPYYLKKINDKSIIYHYDKLPGLDGATKTSIDIIPSDKIKISEESQQAKKEEDNSDEFTKREQNTVDKKKIEKVEKKKKEKKIEKVEKKSKSKKKYRYVELTKSEIKKINKYKERSKNLRIINSEDSYIQTTKAGKVGQQAAQFLAAEHCSKNNFFAYSFKDSGYGEWYEPPFKRATYFYCTNQLIFINPFTGKEVTWTNYEKKIYFKYPKEHLFLYRTMTSTYKRLLEKKKKKIQRCLKLSLLK